MKRTLAAVALLATLTACSGGEQADSSEPEPSFEVPAGITLTEPGEAQEVGSTASVAYPDREYEAGTVLTLGVGQVTKAPRRDLGLFSVPQGRDPYYVSVMVANRGPSPASFDGGVPMWLHLAGDTLLPASASATVPTCRGVALPEPLPAGRTVKGCLLFLVPRGTAVESVDFQPGDVTTAVRWTP